jgi:hypothetical protein
MRDSGRGQASRPAAARHIKGWQPRSHLRVRLSAVASGLTVLVVWPADNAHR